MTTDATSLDHLHDIIAPPPVPWWPPAPAWYWLLAFAFAALVGVILWLIARRQANAYRREALAALAQSSFPLASLPELLKRAALSCYPREAVASLTGDAWLAFLDRTAHTTAFTQGAGRPLARLAHDPLLAAALPERDRAALVAIARDWIVRHDPAADA